MKINAHGKSTILNALGAQACLLPMGYSVGTSQVGQWAGWNHRSARTPPFSPRNRHPNQERILPSMEKVAFEATLEKQKCRQPILAAFRITKGTEEVIPHFRKRFMLRV